MDSAGFLTRYRRPWIILSLWNQGLELQVRKISLKSYLCHYIILSKPGSRNAKLHKRSLCSRRLSDKGQRHTIAIYLCQTKQACHSPEQNRDPQEKLFVLGPWEIVARLSSMQSRSHLPLECMLYRITDVFTCPLCCFFVFYQNPLDRDCKDQGIQTRSPW